MADSHRPSQLPSQLPPLLSTHLPRSRASRRPLGRTLLMRLVALMLATSLVSCASAWDRVREQERIFALETARTQTGRGQCANALKSLDRAQARIDLGAYSRESTAARARCYEKLGFTEFAAAHRRMLDDFYAEEPMAYPTADGASVFRVKTVPAGGFSRPPSWLKMPAPRYTPYAQRSKIVGRVVVSFELAGNNRPRKIRILEMPHPLLASWAVEAIASAQPKKKEDDPILMPGERYVTTFLFEWRWAKEAPSEPLDS